MPSIHDMTFVSWLKDNIQNEITYSFYGIAVVLLNVFTLERVTAHQRKVSWIFVVVVRLLTLFFIFFRILILFFAERLYIYQQYY